MTGKVTLIFPGFQGFPSAVGTLMFPSCINMAAVLAYGTAERLTRSRNFISLISLLKLVYCSFAKPHQKSFFLELWTELVVLQKCSFCKMSVLFASFLFDAVRCSLKPEEDIKMYQHLFEASCTLSL